MFMQFVFQRAIHCSFFFRLYKSVLICKGVFFKRGQDNDQKMTRSWQDTGQTDKIVTRYLPDNDKIVTRYWQDTDKSVTRYWPDNDKMMTRQWQDTDQTMTRLWQDTDRLKSCRVDKWNLVSLDTLAKQVKSCQGDNFWSWLYTVKTSWALSVCEKGFLV